MKKEYQEPSISSIHTQEENIVPAFAAGVGLATGGSAATAYAVAKVGKALFGNEAIEEREEKCLNS